MPYYNVLQAKTAVASASSYLNTGYYKAPNAIDGNFSPASNSTTRWISAGGNLGEWLQVDIGAVVRVNKFMLIFKFGKMTIGSLLGHLETTLIMYSKMKLNLISSIKLIKSAFISLSIHTQGTIVFLKSKHMGALSVK
jgi:hypothetical protein